MIADNSGKSAVEEQPSVEHSAPSAGSSVPRQASPSSRRKQSKWSWTIINFWLDSLLLVVFLSLIWVSTVIRFVFPSASAAEGWLLWGYALDEWMALQYTLTAIFALGILLHLMLHWSWVCGVFFARIWRYSGSSKPDDGTRTIYGVGLMIVVLNVLGLLIAAAVLSIQAPP